MSALHPVAVEAAEYLVSDADEQYTIDADKLALIDQRLQGLRGGSELPAALEGLGKLATCLGGAGSPTVAGALVELIARRAQEVRALRQRLCGASLAEHDALLAFGRFAEVGRALPRTRHPDARPVRDFRIAFMLERQAAEEAQLGRGRRHWRAQQRRP